MKAMPHSNQKLTLEYTADQMESLALSHHQMSVNDTDQPPPQKRRHLDEFDNEVNQQPNNGELQAYQQDVVKNCSW